MFTKRYLVFSHGKRAPRKSPKADFSPKFANRAKTARFAFPTAATTTGIRLHTQCLDGPAPGYILKWLGTVRSLRVRTRKARTGRRLRAVATACCQHASKKTKNYFDTFSTVPVPLLDVGQ
jgi:hypothetical protein